MKFKTAFNTPTILNQETKINGIFIVAGNVKHNAHYKKKNKNIFFLSTFFELIVRY